MAPKMLIRLAFNAGEIPTSIDIPIPTPTDNAIVCVEITAVTSPMENSTKLAISGSRAYCVVAHAPSIPKLVPIADRMNAWVTVILMGNDLWEPSTRNIPYSLIFSSMLVVKMPFIKMPEIMKSELPG